MTITIPDLSGLIAKDDVNHIKVKTQNGGSYEIDYISWAKTSQLLKKHAPGWEFKLRQSNNDNWLFYAPNGTAFFMCYFTSPDGESTADFPYSIMDHRNNPIPFEKIHARIFTDNHRRAYVACSCFTFGFAHEMWSQEEVQDTLLRQSITDTQQQLEGDPVRDPSKPVVNTGYGKRLDGPEQKITIELIKTFNKQYPDHQDYLMNKFSDKWLDGECKNDAKFWTKHLKFQNQVDFVKEQMELKEKKLENIPF